MDPERYRILVVDDDAGVCQLLKDILQSEGYQVELASDGAKAITLVREHSFDLLLVDLVMPEMEGIETIKTLHRQRPNLKMIAMSGAFGGDYLRIASILGAHSTLAKPMRADQVLSAVRAALEG